MKKKLVILICGIMVLNLTGCGKSDLEDAKKEQKAAEEKLEKKVAETEKINKEQKEIENGIQKIKEFCNTHLKDPIFKDIMSTCKTHGYANPTLITDLETIREILKLIKA